MDYDHLLVEAGPTKAKLWVRSQLLYDGPRVARIELLADILREYRIPVEVRSVSDEELEDSRQPLGPKAQAVDEVAIAEAEEEEEAPPEDDNF